MAARLRLAKESGMKIMTLLEKRIIPRKIMTEKAFTNALAVDMIRIDIRNKTIDVQLTKQEIRRRLSKWKPPAAKVTTGYLSRYAQRVSSADDGAIVK
jgi:dihydroxyacid dehydratase/phosphogluconate dehydratase